MEMHTLELGPLETNGYLLIEPEEKSAVLIDAPIGIGAAVEPLLSKTDSQLKAILLTHGHYDHMLGLPELEKFKAPVYAHAKDQEMVENPTPFVQHFMPGAQVEGGRIDHFIETGDRLKFINRDFEVRHAPGHCPGSVIFYIESEKIAFVGDVMFAGSIGRTDFPFCSFEELEKSIREQIYTLPDDTELFPGHGPKTSVSKEKAHNPYVPG